MLDRIALQIDACFDGLQPLKLAPRAFLSAVVASSLSIAS
jgi:hypothetical protein